MITNCPTKVHYVKMWLMQIRPCLGGNLKPLMQTLDRSFQIVIVVRLWKRQACRVRGWEIGEEGWGPPGVGWHADCSPFTPPRLSTAPWTMGDCPAQMQWPGLLRPLVSYWFWPVGGIRRKSEGRRRERSGCFPLLCLVLGLLRFWQWLHSSKEWF